MKIFVAGATGVIGRSLVPELLAAGHDVIAMGRDRQRLDSLAALGAEAVICDVFEPAEVERALLRARPDLLVHQLTALPTAIDPRKIEEHLAANDRIRVEGTRNLLRGAERAGVQRVIAQSIAFAYTPEGAPAKKEDEPLWLQAPWPWQRSVAAVDELERQVLSATGMAGLVLRYGYFYGPGTAYALDGSMAHLVRERQFPIAGRGEGVFSFIHIQDAVQATLAAVASRETGIYNVVDDDPASLRDWLPVYAEALGAPRPRRVFPLLARIAAGRYGLYLATRQRGAVNTKAKQQLDWRPRFASWRDGFHAALESEAASNRVASVLPRAQHA